MVVRGQEDGELESLGHGCGVPVCDDKKFSGMVAHQCDCI